MNGDDLQIFPSLAPDTPEPDFPTPGAPTPSPFKSSSSESSTDDILLEGLTQSERDRVVAAWARLEEVETSYPGTLAVCLTSAARAHARAANAAIKALGEAPDKIKNAADSVNMAAENNERLIQQVATTAEKLCDAAKAQQESQKYTEKLSRWTFSLCISGLILFMLVLGALTATWVAAEKMANMGESAQRFEADSDRIRRLQVLTHSRLILQGDENQLQSEWRKLQSDIREAGQQTDEHRARYGKLKEWKEGIDSRWEKQNQAEAQVLNNEK